MAKKPTANKSKQETVNRANVIRRNDDVANITVGLYEHDEAVKYYIDNHIKPHVVDSNNESSMVPVIYGSPERWKSVQKTTFYRDKEGKTQVPLIMYKRTSIEKDRSLSRNVDANNPQIHQYITNQRSPVNKYDDIDRLIGRIPVRELHRVVVPDYVTLTYEFIIWTDFIGQMNKIIEAINYAEGAFWGDPKRFIFSTAIDNFSNTVEVNQGEDRAIRTSFSLQLRGYIIPDNIQKAATEQSQKVFTRAVVHFGESVDGNLITQNNSLLTVGGGQPNGTGVGGNATININGVLYSLVPASTTEDIPVINTAADPVGEISASNVLIDDVTFSVLNPDSSVITSSQFVYSSSYEIDINSYCYPAQLSLSFPDGTTDSYSIASSGSLAVSIDPELVISLAGTETTYTFISPAWSGSYTVTSQSLAGAGSISTVVVDGNPASGSFISQSIAASVSSSFSISGSVTSVTLTF